MNRFIARLFSARKKWVILSLLVTSFMWFWFCLPEQLFNDPYSTTLLDRNSLLLGAHIAKDGQWRFPALEKVPEKYATAVTVFEDKRYYKHHGVDPIALARAIKQNISANEIKSGASTITMQTIRLSRKNYNRGYFEKLIETILALRLELKFSKNEILALYASHAPFGGNIVGLETASWRYFKRGVNDLSWAEYSLLAVLPNAPGLIHPGRNRKDLVAKRNLLLKRLAKLGHFDATTLELALLEPIPEGKI